MTPPRGTSRDHPQSCITEGPTTPLRWLSCGLTFDLSGGAKALSGLWDVRDGGVRRHWLGVDCVRPSGLPTQTLPSASVRLTVNPAARYILSGPKWFSPSLRALGRGLASTN